MSRTFSAAVDAAVQRERETIILLLEEDIQELVPASPVATGLRAAIKVIRRRSD